MGIETALLVAGVASATMAAAGSAMGGVHTQQAARYQGEELVAQAGQEHQAAGQRISNEDFQANQVLGRIGANTGAAGVTPEGSPDIIAKTSESQAITNDMFTRYSGNLAALKDVYAAKELNYQGSQAKVAGFTQAGETLTSAATSAYTQYKLGLGTKGTTPGGTNPQGGSLYNTN